MKHNINFLKSIKMMFKVKFLRECVNCANLGNYWIVRASVQLLTKLCSIGQGRYNKLQQNCQPVHGIEKVKPSRFVF